MSFSKVGGYQPAGMGQPTPTGTADIGLGRPGSTTSTTGSERTDTAAGGIAGGSRHEAAEPTVLEAAAIPDGLTRPVPLQDRKAEVVDPSHPRLEGAPAQGPATPAVPDFAAVQSVDQLQSWMTQELSAATALLTQPLTAVDKDRPGVHEEAIGHQASSARTELQRLLHLFGQFEQSLTDPARGAPTDLEELQEVVRSVAGDLGDLLRGLEAFDPATPPEEDSPFTLQFLIDQAEREAELSPSQREERVAALRAIGLSETECQHAVTAGLDVKAAGRLKAHAGTITAGAVDFSPYLKAGFTRGVARELMAEGLGVEGGQMLRRLGVPMLPRVVANVQSLERQQEGPLRSLGRGSFNQTYLVTVREGEQGVDKVFKPHKHYDDLHSFPIGMDPARHQIYLRNLATSELAREVQFDVIVDSHLAVAMVTPQVSTSAQPLDGPAPAAPPPPVPTFGVLMEKAQGQIAAEADAALLTDPVVRQKLLQLQLLDHLAGQVDRHDGNYLIFRDASGQVQVRGIDNDLCWGDALMSAYDIVEDSETRQNFKGTRLPPVVDEATAQLMRAMTPGKLTALLKALGLSAAQIEAALSRLASIHEHLDELAASHPTKIVPLAELGTSSLSTLGLSSGNSYIGRLVEYKRSFSEQLDASVTPEQVAQLLPAPDMPDADPGWVAYQAARHTAPATIDRKGVPTSTGGPAAVVAADGYTD